MNHIMRMSTKLSTISSCFRIKHSNPNPFIILSSSSLHTSPPKQPSLKPSDLDTAFDCINTIDEAVTLFHIMLQMHPYPSVQDYDILFQTILKMEHYTHVILMFKKLTFLGRQVNEYTMNNVVNCYAHLKEVELGFAVIAGFIKRGYAPDIVTFTCLIKGFFLKGKLNEAVCLYKDLIREKLCEVDEVTTLTVLDGLSKAGNVVEAVEFLRLVERNNWRVDVKGYNAVIDGLCKARMLKDCMELFLSMVDRDVFPDVISYTCLIHGLCMNGKLAFACRIFNVLSSKGVSANVITYNVMIQGLLGGGLFLEAKELLEKMEQVGCFPDEVTYRVIIQGCLQQLHNVDSVNLLTQIVGKDFQLDAPSFFLLLRHIQVVRDMKGVYDDDVCNQLIQKLLSGRAIHQLRDSKDEFVINSLISKMNSSDGKCSVS